jgi:CPA1 family monovalent cation:H+ antiporter
MVTIIEGESLVNDATGLVLYKFGIAAVLTGTFSLAQASMQFVLVVVVGVAIGLVVARVSALAFLHIKDPGILITLSLLVPYVAYVSAEALHVSGVLAAVSTGLYLGWKEPQLLTAQTRLQAIAVWRTLIFLLNGIIFLLIGLQLPVIWASLSGYRTSTLLGWGAAILLVVVLVRPLWVFPGAYIPRWLSRRIRETEERPTAGMVWVTSLSGMRGVVSLAAALALPVATAKSEAFPFRELIVFLTFAVILGTLVGQGLTLAPLIRWLAIPSESADLMRKAENDTRIELLRAARTHVTRMAELQRFPEQALAAVSAFYDGKLADLAQQGNGEAATNDAMSSRIALRREAIAAARRRLRELQWEDRVTLEVMHQLQHELDIEEERLG